MARCGHVYVMRVDAASVKVGFSITPNVRGAMLGLTVIHVGDWHDAAELIERAAHRILKADGKHLKNEIFAASQADAIAAVRRAYELADAGALDSTRRPAEKRKTSVRL